MFDMTSLPILILLGVSLTFWAGILRTIRGGDATDVASAFGRPWELTWPRGVQEEELRPWRLDRLGQRTVREPHRAAEVAPTIEAARECTELDAAA